MIEISSKASRKLGEKIKLLRLSGWQRIGILLTPLLLIVAYSVSHSLSRHHTVRWWYEATNFYYKRAGSEKLNEAIYECPPPDGGHYFLTDLLYYFRLVKLFFLKRAYS
jgi:hypothetical protein